MPALHEHSLGVLRPSQFRFLYICRSSCDQHLLPRGDCKPLCRMWCSVHLRAPHVALSHVHPSGPGDGIPRDTPDDPAEDKWELQENGPQAEVTQPAAVGGQGEAGLQGDCWEQATNWPSARVCCRDREPRHGSPRSRNRERHADSCPAGGHGCAPSNPSSAEQVQQFGEMSVFPK